MQSNCSFAIYMALIYRKWMKGFVRFQISLYISCKTTFCQKSRKVCSVYPSGTHEFTPGFSRVRVTQSLVLCVMFCRSLFFLLFFFFWPLYCLFFFCWPLCCLSFFLWPLCCLSFFFWPLCCLFFFFWPLCCLSFFFWPLCCLSFFFWPLCCLSFFYLLILITRLQTLLKNRLVLFVYKSTINVLRF